MTRTAEIPATNASAPTPAVIHTPIGIPTDFFEGDIDHDDRFEGADGNVFACEFQSSGSTGLFV